MPPPADDMTDLDQPVTRRELRQELEAVLKALATKDDLKAMSDELRRHFDTVAEAFKSDFANLYDWVEANTSSLTKRVETLETNHGPRLLMLETRVSALEAGRPTRTPKQ